MFLFSDNIYQIIYQRIRIHKEESVTPLQMNETISESNAIYGLDTEEERVSDLKE